MAEDHPVVAADHKPLSDKDIEQLAKEAFECERKIKIAVQAVHGGWWLLAEQAYAFHEAGYWQILGYDSLDEFLAQPDIGMSRSSFFHMTKTWRDLVVVKQLPPADLKELEPSKVREVVPAIMRGEVEPADALDDAKQLSYRDIKTKYRPEKQQQTGQAADDSTKLDASAEPEYTQCEACGSWVPKEDVIDGDATETTDET